MGSGSEYDVFLSHCGVDKPEVELLATRLRREAGLRPFLDKWHLVSGRSVGADKNSIVRRDFDVLYCAHVHSGDRRRREVLPLTNVRV